MAQRHGEPFRGEAMTEQAIAEKALSAHATDEALGTAPNSHRCDQKDNPNASVF
jgi:hypothetical protein